MELTDRSDRDERTGQSDRRAGRTFRTDDRGRVPLAIVGVVLVVTSVAFVGHVLPRATVTPDLDASGGDVAVESLEIVHEGMERTA